MCRLSAELDKVACHRVYVIRAAREYIRLAASAGGHDGGGSDGHGPAVDMWPLYKVSGMSRDNVVRTRYFHYVYDLSTCLHVKIAASRG